MGPSGTLHVILDSKFNNEIYIKKDLALNEFHEIECIKIGEKIGVDFYTRDGTFRTEMELASNGHIVIAEEMFSIMIFPDIITDEQKKFIIESKDQIIKLLNKITFVYEVGIDDPYSERKVFTLSESKSPELKYQMICDEFHIKYKNKKEGGKRI